MPPDNKNSPPTSPPGGWLYSSIIGEPFQRLTELRFWGFEVERFNECFFDYMTARFGLSGYPISKPAGEGVITATLTLKVTWFRGAANPVGFI